MRVICAALVMAVVLGGDAFADRCQVRPLVKWNTDQLITGPEDLVLDARQGRIIISAHNRTSVDEDPTAGLYAVALSALRGQGQVEAFPLITDKADFRPHGIAIQGDQLAVINHAGEGEGVGPRGTRLELFRIEARGLRLSETLRSPMLCNANDVVSDGEGGWLFTRTGSSCGGVGGFLDLLSGTLGGGTGQVVRLTPDGEAAVIASDLKFANGLLRLADGRIVVAETQGKSLKWLGGERWDVGAGPDNLMLDQSGAILTAVHDAPFRLFLGLKGRTDTVPSRLVRIVSTRETETLYASDGDPAKGGYPAATVLLDAGEVYVAGSVLASSLLVCPKPAKS